MSNVDNCFPDTECCGPRPHELTDDTQICCKDRLHPTAGGRTLCTDGIVHSPMETVCDGVRYDVANGQCCGKVIMDDTKICCQGFIYSKEDHGTECCGKVAYDPSALPLPLCCDGTLHLDASDLQCCGNQVINSTERECCGVEGHRFAFLRSSGQTCCGLTAGDYDSSQHTCCQGLLHKFLPNGECCGNAVVRDTSKEVCCGGLIQRKQYKEDTLCCNGHILDSRRFTCCGNVTLQRRSRLPYRCCNGIIFNRQSQLCEAGEVRAKDSEETTAVEETTNARRMFARQTEHAQRFTRDATDTADYDIQLTTEAEGQTAHVQERMMPWLPGATDATPVACDGLSYDIQVQGCCQGVLYRLANETCMNGSVLGLCDSQSVYNPLTHGCCGGQVYNQSIKYCDETTTLVSYNSESSEQSNDIKPSTSAPEDQLCGGRVYNQTLQGCCDDRLYNLITEYCRDNSTVMPMVPSQPDRRESTTASTTTTAIESTTDEGFMLVTQEPCSVIRVRENASEEMDCCGSLLYHPLNATCCQGITDQGDGTVVAWSAVTEDVVAGRCCAETAYHPTLAVCCNGEVFGRAWLTPDIFNGCCPEGEQWNRILEVCEPIPTQEPITMDGSSGMSPDDRIW
ncbi:uncharacterized protein LOC119721521 [Patiria miniata]|uniref:Galaxin-like repeats domain-containing protein n=1 Tax=Patiria miniata TaxID=46514 RepID=A0A913Z935_PATMI|nr:uncharacterized protein LOC119721521 [Patiria miniata]